MKRIIPLLACLLFGPVLVTASVADFHPEVEDELKEDNFWADVTFAPDSTSTVTEFRVWYQHTADKVFGVLIDTNSFPQVHDNYEDAAVLPKATFDAVVAKKPEDREALTPLIDGKKIPSESGRKAGGKWTRYEFVSFNFPWPLSDRWSVQKAVIDESQASQGRYRYDYEMFVGNFKTLKGYWELVPVPGKPGWTEFRGRYVSDPGIALPKPVTKAATKAGLKKDVEDNRRILAKK